MKRLAMFAPIQMNLFLAGKTLMAMKSEDLTDFNSGTVTGAKYTVLIWSDKTDYGDPNVSNAGETFTVKIIGAKPRSITQPTQVNLIEPSGVIYGDYRNNLSVTAKDVVPVQRKEAQ